MADRSYALNPRQVNFIIPTITVSPDGVRAGPNCGASGTGFAVSYGAYDSITTRCKPLSRHRHDPSLDGRLARSATTPAFDNTRITPELLNMASIGTAEWAAKVRAHFYQQDLSTGLAPRRPRDLGRQLRVVGPLLQDAGVLPAGRLPRAGAGMGRRLDQGTWPSSTRWYPKRCSGPTVRDWPAVSATYTSVR